MRKNDRRTRKTKKAIKEALATLLQNRALKNISVSQITELADISRSTFYAHYQDIYDLYDQMENDVLEDISRIIVEAPSHEYGEIYIKLINYIYDNATICHSFMGNSMNNQFRNKLSSFFEERYNRIVLYEMKSETMHEEWKYISRYLNGGCIHAISLWLESDFSVPKDTLIQIIKNIDEVCDPLYELY